MLWSFFNTFGKYGNSHDYQYCDRLYCDSFISNALAKNIEKTAKENQIKKWTREHIRGQNSGANVAMKII
jgi:hypothetical protein